VWVRLAWYKYIIVLRDFRESSENVKHLHVHVISEVASDEHACSVFVKLWKKYSTAWKTST
jgi:diadenosine tetraphosphate (Ap4A) HIT family hydrolase